MKTAIAVTKPTETQRLFSEFWQRSSALSIPETQRHTAAVAAALNFLASVFDRRITDDTVKGYLATLKPLSEVQCVNAFSLALESSRFFPTPAELRALAGIPDAKEVERHASDKALAETLGIIRKHGPQLRTIPGKVIRDRDGDGRIMNMRDWVREPETVAPVLDHRVVETVRAVGTGEFWSGLRLLATHPSVQGREEERTHPAEVKRIEDRWHEAFKRAAEELAA